MVAHVTPMQLQDVIPALYGILLPLPILKLQSAEFNRPIPSRYTSLM
jgi:hypothetical protein